MKTIKSATTKARAYLVCEEASEAKELAKQLDTFEGDLAKVITALRATPPEKAETGWTNERPFQSPRLAAKYGDHCLTVYVPPDYDAAKPRGLLIFLHGGGRTVGNIDYCDSRPFAPGSQSINYSEGCGIRDLLEQSGYILCFPSAPIAPGEFARWSMPIVDEYLADVIEELETFYAIDPNHVLLGGQSMGGMGAIHVAHRMADRFASVWASAFCWDLAYWPCLTGTPFWICQGSNDAVMFRRRHGTDIEFARIAHERLSQAGAEHYYREHSGGHPLPDGRAAFREWLAWTADRRRDPFHPRVVAVSPRGMTPWTDIRRHPVPLVASMNYVDFHGLAPAPHARWVSLDGLGEETVIFDMAVMSKVDDAVEEDWNNFRLEARRKNVRAGIVEATVVNRNVIEVMPKNVTGFTLWLHPDMVDFGNLAVFARGKEVFQGSLKPSLSTMLDSYKRRRDWGMLYPAKVRVDYDEAWETKDQLNVRHP